MCEVALRSSSGLWSSDKSSELSSQKPGFNPLENTLSCNVVNYVLSYYISLLTEPRRFVLGTASQWMRPGASLGVIF